MSAMDFEASMFLFICSRPELLKLKPCRTLKRLCTEPRILGLPARDVDSGGMGVDPGDEAVLGLHCNVQASLVVVRGLLIAVASLVAEHRLQGTWAQ